MLLQVLLLVNHGIVIAINILDEVDAQSRLALSCYLSELKTVLGRVVDGFLYLIITFSIDRCLEKFMRFVNRNAYILCAVNGTNFCTSAKDAFSLLLRNSARVVVLDKVIFFNQLHLPNISSFIYLKMYRFNLNFHVICREINFIIH